MEETRMKTARVTAPLTGWVLQQWYVPDADHGRVRL